MATIRLDQPMDTIQFIFGSTTAVSGARLTPVGFDIEFGAELTLSFRGLGLAMNGLEPAGGSVTEIVAFRGAERLGVLTPDTTWAFTRTDLGNAFAGEEHRIYDSAGYDILRGGNLGDFFSIGGSEDQVLAGAGNDRIEIVVSLLPEILPGMDLQGGAGSDTVFLLGTGTQIIDLRSLTLTAVEHLVLDGIFGTTLDQAMAAGFDSIAGRMAGGRLYVRQSQAVLDLNDLNFVAGDQSIVHGQGTIAADTIIAHRSVQSVLQGYEGADTLQGGVGDDELSGSRGRDRLNGGRGDDLIYGGQGRDLFIFAGRSGDDVVDDFRAFGPNRDRIDLTAINGITGFADLRRDHLRVAGDDLILELGRGNSVQLEDVSRADLDAGDFLFGG